VLARVLETHGIVTTSISLVREHTEAVKPPRALFVPFPYGHALGRPDDPALQHRVLRAALALTDEAAGPVLRDFPDEGALADQPGAPTQASAIAPSPLTSGDPVAETAAMGEAYTRWLEQRDGRTAFGLSGVSLARLAEAVRALGTFADGGDAEFPDRPRAVPLPGYVRRCADDVKALFAEGYMATKPDAGGEEIARWFWGETAVGQLLHRVRARLDASDDPRWKAAAFGVAR
jgi:hypothetical protein